MRLMVYFLMGSITREKLSVKLCLCVTLEKLILLWSTFLRLIGKKKGANLGFYECATWSCMIPCPQTDKFNQCIYFWKEEWVLNTLMYYRPDTRLKMTWWCWGSNLMAYKLIQDKISNFSRVIFTGKFVPEVINFEPVGFL